MNDGRSSWRFGAEVGAWYDYDSVKGLGGDVADI